MNKNFEEFLKGIEESKNIVFFGGAGVSTESGIPDFRSVDGIYNQTYVHSPETMLSHHFFMKHPEDFYEFYWDKMIYHGALPNVTHKKLAKLEKIGKLNSVITQNIDGLHQMAGSQNVQELHGSVRCNHCMVCGAYYSLEDILLNKSKEDKKYVPHCSCGGVIKPDVILYEEGLDEGVIQNTVEFISNADMLIIGGTSLSVYPAANFIRYFKGNWLVLINKTPTPYDKHANLVINCGLGEVFSHVHVDNLATLCYGDK